MFAERGGFVGDFHEALESPLLYSPLIERALRVAAFAHANQSRKATTIPYLTHLAGTALVLTRAGIVEERVLAAALLHDGIEDTDLTAEQIAQEFGEDVAQMVVDASEIKLDESGQKIAWHERKREHRHRLRECSVESRAIVLADKVHNLGTIVDDLAVDPSTWTRFRATPEESIHYFETMFELAEGEESLRPVAETGAVLLQRLRRYLPVDQSSSTGSN